MQVYTSQQQIKAYVNSSKQKDLTIGFVPTMGCLHEGHLSLIKRAKSENDIVIVSIFVNPTQFSPNEDLDKYPRPIEQDKAKLIDLSVDVLFFPSTEEMYGDENSDDSNPTELLFKITSNQLFSSKLNITELTNKLCGKYRPGHFDGVVTIVAKLFEAVSATRAYFGSKDWQQQLIIRKMVEGLNLPIEIISCPIIREPDGLAKSSRNAYMSPQARKKAPCLYQSLQIAKNAYQQGETSPETIKALINDKLSTIGYPLSTIQYLEVCNSKNLKPVQTIKPGTLIALAVFIQEVRLIDNWVVGSSLD